MSSEGLKEGLTLAAACATILRQGLKKLCTKLEKILLLNKIYDLLNCSNMLSHSYRQQVESLLHDLVSCIRHELSQEIS
jgi:HD superfamily phosphodiesterase